MKEAPRVLNRPTSFRLSEASSSAANKVDSSLEVRSVPFTHDKFMEGWGEFIARNPHLHILVNAMRASQPTPAGGNSYSIVVDHPAQQQAFELSMTKLIEFLRGYLSNDLLTLKVEISDAPTGAKQLPPKEFLKQVVASNPAMARFLNELNAELV